MNTDSIKSTAALITRRRALGLAMAGAALSVSAAAPKVRTAALWTVRSSTRLIFNPCTNEGVAALFESTMSVDSTGAARGFTRLTLGPDVVEHVAELGGLDIDSTGEPVRVWLLLRKLGSSGKVAHDFMFGSVAPEPSEDCLIYTTIGCCWPYDFNPTSEPVRFEVPGRWEVRHSR